MGASGPERQFERVIRPPPGAFSTSPRVLLRPLLLLIVVLGRRSVSRRQRAASAASLSSEALWSRASPLMEFTPGFSTQRSVGYATIGAVSSGQLPAALRTSPRDVPLEIVAAFRALVEVGRLRNLAEERVSAVQAPPPQRARRRRNTLKGDQRPEAHPEKRIEGVKERSREVPRPG